MMADDSQLDITFVEELDTRDPEMPKAFQMFDDTIDTNTSCPSCGYQWNESDGASEGLTPDDMPSILTRCPKCGYEFEDDAQQEHGFSDNACESGDGHNGDVAVPSE